MHQPRNATLMTSRLNREAEGPFKVVHECEHTNKYQTLSKKTLRQILVAGKQAKSCYDANEEVCQHEAAACKCTMLRHLHVQLGTCSSDLVT